LTKLEEPTPGHLLTVRRHVIDKLIDEQIDQLAEIGDAHPGPLVPKKPDGGDPRSYHATPERQLPEAACAGQQRVTRTE
jgi:hypothetical protein